MTAEAHLRGEGCQLVLRATGYEYPELATGDDANWVTGEVELSCVRVGRFTATVAVALRTDELAAFVEQLRTVDAELAGEARLTHLEAQLGATVCVNGDGGGTLSAFVRDHVEAELRVADAPIDPSAVRVALDEFAALVDAFPVRGQPF
ncbi:MAG TPA: hypothetical protein VHX62_07470 [Solirubrobacteraceae bacterium]|jgi:hypothetical protein|nr:hypothetical protein [Solirubrobacteraceae bacterium]